MAVCTFLHSHMSKFFWVTSLYCLYFRILRQVPWSLIKSAYCSRLLWNLCAWPRMQLFYQWPFYFFVDTMWRYKYNVISVKKKFENLLLKLHYCTYISTLSTLMPHASVASSRESCMVPERVSRSLKISWRGRVPIVLRKVVWARSLVEWWAFSTFAMDIVALWTR